MHNTTERKKRDSDGFTIKLDSTPTRNLFTIEAQIAQNAMFDKRRERRRIKAARKARKWKED